MPTPLDFYIIGALGVLLVVLSTMLYRYMLAADQWQDMWDEMTAEHIKALRHIDRLTETELEYIAFKREVEEVGYADYEVQRLRAANGKLAVQLGELNDAVQDYMVALAEDSEYETLAVFKSFLDTKEEI